LTQRIDPVDAMLQIGARFLRQAEELDERTAAAIEANAAQHDITALMDLAATDRLRALSAFQACAPYCRPKLQAIELAPASQSTVSRFEQRISGMTEEQITGHLKAIANGASALALIESADDA
jgi:hypothetical protein